MQPMLNAAAKTLVAPPTQMPTTFLLHPEYNHDGVIKGFTPIYLPDFSANKSAKKPAHKHK